VLCHRHTLWRLLYLVYAFVAMAIDRGALLVSSLVYVPYAMCALFRSAGAAEGAVAFTALVIGSALLTSAFSAVDSGSDGRYAR
jgi:hypothetical protein